jgi:hypothetical protein
MRLIDIIEELEAGGPGSGRHPLNEDTGKPKAFFVSKKDHATALAHGYAHQGNGLYTHPNGHVLQMSVIGDWQRSSKEGTTPRYLEWKQGQVILPNLGKFLDQVHDRLPSGAQYNGGATWATNP